MIRRAIAEARADAAYERRLARTRWERACVALSHALAVARIVLAGITPSGEKYMRNLTRDVAYGARRLRHAPWMSVFAIVTLALGIGMVTAVFSVTGALFAADAGVADSERVVRIYHKLPPGSGPMISLSLPDYEDLRGRQTVFSAVAAHARVRQPIAVGGEATIEWGEIVSGEFFRVLGVTPALGRLVQPADDRHDAPDVVVLSLGLWRRAFGADPAVIGSVARIAGRPFEVIGVAPDSFRGGFMPKVTPAAFWVPFGGNAALVMRDEDLTCRDCQWVRVQAKLAPGRTVDDAQTEVSRIAAQLDAAYPIGEGLDRARYGSYNWSRPWVALPFSSVKIAESADRLVEPLATAVTVVATLVLLVVCTNVANLLLARSADRAHDLGVRVALGASRWRLIREQIVESGLLAGVGGLLGVLFAQLLLARLGGDFLGPARLTFHVDPSLEPASLAAAAGATALAIVIFGAWPAWRSRHANARHVLASTGSLSVVPRWRGRSILIAGQVAVSVVLIAMAALSIRQAARQAGLDTGIDLDRLAVMHIEFERHGLDEARGRTLAADLRDRIDRLPGVSAAAISSGLPFGINSPGARVAPLGTPLEKGWLPGVRNELLVSTPEVFDALGIAITRGRAFDARDTRLSDPVIVVSEAVAREVFGGIDVVGRQVAFHRQKWVGDPEWPIETKRIIGVAADTDAGMAGRREAGTIYVPFSQRYEPWLTFSARTNGDPARVAGQMRALLRAVDSHLAPAELGAAVDVAGPETAFLDATSRLTGVLGGGAVVLALAGLYGVLSHVVAKRRREIGVRMALGASSRTVERMVLRDGLRPVIWGVVLGIGVGVAIRMSLTPLFSNLLPGLDWSMLAVVALVFLIAGAAACYVPAHRAAGVDPSLALRDT